MQITRFCGDSAMDLELWVWCSNSLTSLVIVLKYTSMVVDLEFLTIFISILMKRDIHVMYYKHLDQLHI